MKKGFIFERFNKFIVFIRDEGRTLMAACCLLAHLREANCRWKAYFKLLTDRKGLEAMTCNNTGQTSFRFIALFFLQRTFVLS